jgi:hypothetical protein
MIEVIVTAAIPPKTQLVHGTGALLSRDYYEETEPAHVEVYQVTFDNQAEFDHWIFWLQKSSVKRLKA